MKDSYATTLPGNTIVITGLGMTSSLGADVISSCAAARAGLTRWQELDLRVTDSTTLETVPLKGHEVSWLTLGFEGFARWLQLGDAALRDLLEYAGMNSSAFPMTGIHLQLPGDFLEDVHIQTQVISQVPQSQRDPIHRALLAERTEARERLERRFLPELLERHHLPLAPRARAYTFGGAASFPRVLAWAAEALRSRALERCIVGGIDSWVDGGALARAFDLGLLRTPNRPVGRFPGEAAAFVLLERLDAARARGARIEGILGPFAFATEGGHRFSGQVSSGATLGEAIAACFPTGATTDGEIELSIVNLNGDERWAREFGGALVRLRAAGLPSTARQWYVPEPFGEIGAATGAAAICLGVRGFVRRYAKSPGILVALLDDDQNRGAFLLHDSPFPARARDPRSPMERQP